MTLTAEVAFNKINTDHRYRNILRRLSQLHKDQPEAYAAVTNKFTYLSRYAPNKAKAIDCIYDTPQDVSDEGICYLVFSGHVKIWNKDRTLWDNTYSCSLVRFNEPFTDLLQLLSAIGLTPSTGYPVEGRLDLFEQEGKWKGERRRQRHELCKLYVKLLKLAKEFAKCTTNPPEESTNG